jgi:rhomboid family GlyGly-CTERM serine protease
VQNNFLKSVFFKSLFPCVSMRLWIYLAIAFMSFSQLFFVNFIYDRQRLWIEPWRLWTGNWLHLGIWHWALNAAALALLPEIFLRISLRFFVFLWFSLPLLLSLMLYFCIPNLTQYAGLSGVLHGIYVAIALNATQNTAVAERRVGWLVVLGLCVKVGWEAYSGNSQTSELIGAPVVLQAHQYGIGLGFLMWLSWRVTTFYAILRFRHSK